VSESLTPVKTYAMACLAVALEADDIASNLVRRGIMGQVMRPLRDSIVGGKPLEGSNAVSKALALASSSSSAAAAAAAGAEAGARTPRTGGPAAMSSDVGNTGIGAGDSGGDAAAEDVMTGAGAMAAAGMPGVGIANDATAAGAALCAALCAQQVPNDLSRLPERLTEAR